MMKKQNSVKKKQLSKGNNKKVISVMKDEIGGKIMKTFIGLRVKTCSYLIDDGNEDKKAKGTKKTVIKTVQKQLHLKIK